MNPTNTDMSVQHALQAWERWNCCGLAHRLETLAPATKACGQPLVSWQMARLQGQMAETVNLPGPTGEANSLHWQGRGVVCLLADDSATEAAIATLAFTALATGNTLLLPAGNSQMQALFHLLTSNGVPEGVVSLATSSEEALTQQVAIAAYAFAGTAEHARTLNRQLAERSGAIPQLIAETDTQQCLHIQSHDFPWRFVTESTLSINTTAVGGNATLLELGGRSDA